MALRRPRVRISLGPLKAAERLFLFNSLLRRPVLAKARRLRTVRISLGPLKAADRLFLFNRLSGGGQVTRTSRRSGCAVQPDNEILGFFEGIVYQHA